MVVNTTGTPYFERQPLRDVVIWCGLGEGIRDGVLKQLANNIRIFDLDEDNAEQLVEQIVGDYWDVALPDGAPARITNASRKRSTSRWRWSSRKASS